MASAISPELLELIRVVRGSPLKKKKPLTIFQLAATKNGGMDGTHVKNYFGITLNITLVFCRFASEAPARRNAAGVVKLIALVILVAGLVTSFGERVGLHMTIPIMKIF